MITVTDPVESFIFEFQAYDHQKAFLESPLPHRLSGGAAGPGKTLLLLIDHMLCCNQFSPAIASQVHTLILRRTYPKLDATVITRFREKIPRELYRSYNDSEHMVTWHNGSTTKFGAMQHEHDVWGYQGQWHKIGYDELTEFTFSQWQNIAAWNRCPVSSHSTKDGATNPIGIGARWVEDIFVRNRPCEEMDAKQKEQYIAQRDGRGKSTLYGYFPATYLENPIYANDPHYIAQLDSYQGPISEALKFGKWGVAGGYFDGAWDEAENVYADGSVQMKPWHRKYLGCDWGFEHNSVVHWFFKDDFGIDRVYRELVCNRHTPEELAEKIAELSAGDGDYDLFSLSHDAFAQRQDVNPIGMRMGAVLAKHGIIHPTPSTKDKIGREQILYDLLKQRVKIGEVFNDQARCNEPVMVARLQIAQSCVNLIRTIPKASRDEKNRETIAEFLGDDALQSSGYALYAMYGDPNPKPRAVLQQERFAKLEDEKDQYGRPLSKTAIMMRQAFDKPIEPHHSPWRIGDKR